MSLKKIMAFSSALFLIFGALALYIKSIPIPASVMVHNDTQQKIVINEIRFNDDEYVYQGARSLGPKTRSFQNEGNFDFQYSKNVNNISVQGMADAPFRLTCQIPSSKKTCYYVIGIKSLNEIACACDDSHDFYQK